MLEGKQAEYRRELIDGIADRLGNEEARVVAVAQAGVPPWMAALPLALAGLIVIASLFAGWLPFWAVLAGIVVAAAAAWYMTWIPRRLLVRTDSQLYVFAMNRSQQEAVGDPLAALAAGELPSDPAAIPAKVAGERLWPNYGAGRERDAMRDALSSALPSA